MKKSQILLFCSLSLCTIYALAHQAFSSNNNVIVRNGQVFSSSGSATMIGSGVIQSQTRTLTPFTEIRLRIPAKTTIVRGASPECAITADDNILPEITTEVQNGILTIASRNGFSSAHQISLNITAPQLSKLLMTASGDVILNGIRENTLEIVIGGAINLRAAGQVGALKVRLDGTGDMDLYRLQARSADVLLNGAGTIHVFATGTFSGLIQGSGEILVRGNPQILRSAVYGAGRIAPSR
jgi:hypothetical protein